MLSIVSLATQAPEAGSALTFDTNRVVSSCSARHTAGSSTVELVQPGYYFISFNTIATAVEATETSPITVTLYNNDDEVLGATSSALSATNTSDVTLTFSTIIQVRPSCCVVNNNGSITVRTVGADATFTEPTLNVFYVK